MNTYRITASIEVSVYERIAQDFVVVAYSAQDARKRAKAAGERIGTKVRILNTLKVSPNASLIASAWR